MFGQIDFISTLNMNIKPLHIIIGSLIILVIFYLQSSPQKEPESSSVIVISDGEGTYQEQLHTEPKVYDEPVVHDVPLDTKLDKQTNTDLITIHGGLFESSDDFDDIPVVEIESTDDVFFESTQNDLIGAFEEVESYENETVIDYPEEVESYEDLIDSPEEPQKLN